MQLQSKLFAIPFLPSDMPIWSSLVRILLWTLSWIVKKVCPQSTSCNYNAVFGELSIICYLHGIWHQLNPPPRKAAKWGMEGEKCLCGNKSFIIQLNLSMAVLSLFHFPVTAPEAKGTAWLGRGGGLWHNDVIQCPLDFSFLFQKRHNGVVHFLLLT